MYIQRSSFLLIYHIWITILPFNSSFKKYHWSSLQSRFDSCNNPCQSKRHCGFHKHFKWKVALICLMTWGLGGFGAFVGTACRNPSQEPKVCIGFMAGLRRINRELVGKLMSMLPSFEPHQLRANNPSAGAWRMETRWFLGTCKRFIHHTSEKCPRRFLSIPREGTATSPQHGSEPVQYLDRRTVVVFWVFFANSNWNLPLFTVYFNLLTTI